MSVFKWLEVPFRKAGSVAAFAVLLLHGLLANNASADPLSISDITIRQGSTVVITGEIPAGLEEVVLEARRRIDKGGWEPVAVRHVDGAGGEVTFRVSLSAALEIFRLRAASNAPLPLSFYEGTSSFKGPISPGGPEDAFRGEVLAPEIADEPQRRVSDKESGDSRQVVESDIWKLKGERLFFFNQLRGLQVIDVSNPDEPRLTGSIKLPAAGEQMYLLEEHVVLLARNGCNRERGEPQSRVLIVNVANGTPEVVAEKTIHGTIEESRMVGSALYVASQGYRPSDVTEASPGTDPIRKSGHSAQEWEIGTTITAFDLSSPDEPVEREQLWYAGYGNTVKATPKYLFLAQHSQFSRSVSEIQVIDISSVEGEMESLSRIRPAGRVQDKFKMHVKENVLTVISQRRRPRKPMQTVLETFSLESPEEPERLGSLVLVEGEQLHATRFKGDLAYVVTFFQVDPLWIVDLSNPKDPKITGELEVPGFSTFIYPLEDELLTMGVEERRVAVSLFDVSDRTNPTLASKVRIGERFSSSEANSDEKAFSVFPGEGLALVPYTSYAKDGSRINGVQLIDVEEGALTKRGVIRHSFQPRRATVYEDRILSFSGWALLSVNAEDRDAPEVVGNLELAWSVEHVFAHEDFLVTLGQRQQRNPRLLSADKTGESGRRATMRVAAKGKSGETVTRKELAAMRILGAAQRDGLLHVLQAESTGSSRGGIEKPKEPETEQKTLLRLTVWDLSSLPAVERVGIKEVAVSEFSVGAIEEVNAVWPKPSLLVWGSVDRRIFRPLGRPARPEPGIVAEPGIGATFPHFGYWGSGGGHLFVYDVAAPAVPKWLGEIDLSKSTEDSRRSNLSQVFATDGKVFFSHQASHHIAPPEPVPDDGDGEGDAEAEREKKKDPHPEGYWMKQHFLDVIDFAEPANPVVRKPVNIPGKLIGVSNNGNLVYTQGRHWERNEKGEMVSDGTTWLDAGAYDGAKVHLVDSLALPEKWPHPVKVRGDRIYLGDPSESDSEGPSMIEIWTVPESGKFTALGEISIKRNAENLNTWGDLLAVYGDDFIQSFDVTDPEAASHLKTGFREGCYEIDLTEADGSLESGLWLPLGRYGIKAIPF